MEEKDLAPKPKLKSGEAQREIDRVEADIDATRDSISAMSLDELNKAPKYEVEPQTRMSTRELQNAKQTYLKPLKTIYAVDPKSGQSQKINPKFDAARAFDSQIVCFTAENNMMIGQKIEIWTRPYGGMPAEYWEVPCNTPVWGPRYLAEQIKRKFYHIIEMDQQTIVGGDGLGSYTGGIEVKKTIQRLDAHPVSQNKSLFMGATGF
jgi:hypothetical protein